MFKNLLSSTAFWGIIGLVVAGIFFMLSNNQREPVYTIVKEPTLIFDKENASAKLKVISTDSTEIKKNIYVTTLGFWNNGNLEIKKEDVREKIEMKLLDGEEILDIIITKQTKPKIANFEIIHESDTTVFIDWDYLDPNFGLEYQVTYSGTSESDIVMDGYVLGASVSKVEPLPEKNLSLFIFMAFILYTIKEVGSFIKNFNKNHLIKNVLRSLLFIASFIYIFWFAYIYFIQGYVYPLAV